MKKLLIIFISLLLLTSFLTYCDKTEETLYGWDTSSGWDGWEWKKMGDKNTNPQYKGEVKREYIIFGDYILEGLGSITEPQGWKYVGVWKNGRLWRGKEYDKYGNITYKWVNGKKIKQ